MIGSSPEFVRDLQSREEYRLKLKEFEKRQKLTFFKIIKRRHEELVPEQKDLFAMYFTDLLLGRCSCINDFLYKNKNKSWNKNNLKNIFNHTKHLNSSSGSY